MGGADDLPVKEILARKGIRSTRQRIAVLEELTASETPLGAEELYIRLHGECENLSLSTVYRILDALCKKGIVAKSGLMEGGRALYEIVAGVHRHNLICIKCHRITPLSNCPLNEYEDKIEHATGYSISGHKLEIYGICPKCK